MHKYNPMYFDRNIENKGSYERWQMDKWKLSLTLESKIIWNESSQKYILICNLVTKEKKILHSERWYLSDSHVPAI